MYDEDSNLFGIAGGLIAIGLMILVGYLVVVSVNNIPEEIVETNTTQINKSVANVTKTNYTDEVKDLKDTWDTLSETDGLNLESI